MKLFLALVLLAGGMAALHADSPPPGLPQPLQAVVDSYLVIQGRLAADSFDGVAAAAAAMKKAVDADKANATFPPHFAQAVNTLAAATDLHSARMAFQPVSGQLIALLAEDRVHTGRLHSLFCPMVKAYWLQTDGATVHNPYMGGEMSDCGAFEKQF